MAPQAAQALGVRLRITEKRFRHDAVPLFEGLELDIAPAETVALIGPSGVGKSTLIRMIAGIDTNWRGELTVGGVASDKAAVPGFVFQEPRLLPWLDAAENVRVADPAMTREAAIAGLADLGLEGKETLLPGELSGGMQRRVALARALAVAPGLLLLDEPFVSLDRKLVRELQEVVAGIVVTHRPTMILVSHDPADAARLAQRVLQLDGRPARFIGDVFLDTPPEDRDAGTVREMSDWLEGWAEK